MARSPKNKVPSVQEILDYEPTWEELEEFSKEVLKKGGLPGVKFQVTSCLTSGPELRGRVFLYKLTRKQAFKILLFLRNFKKVVI